MNKEFDYFISYSHEDSAVADALVECLEKRGKLKAFSSMYEASFDASNKEINDKVNSFQHDIELIVNTSEIKLNICIEDKNKAMETVW